MSTRNFPANVEPIGTRFGANIPDKSGSGSAMPGIIGVANKCRARGDSYLPASMAGQPIPAGAIGSVPTLGHATVEVERKAAKPSVPRTVPTTPAPTGPDWETQYHIAEANVILLRSENELLRARLAKLGVAVTGKPGLATIR